MMKLITILPIIAALSLVPLVQAQSENWTLTVNVNNIQSGAGDVRVALENSNGDVLAQGPALSSGTGSIFQTFSVSGIDVGDSYKVCISSDLQASCFNYQHSENSDAEVDISMS
jgi:uncharacterized protein (DUF2141 family)